MLITELFYALKNLLNFLMGRDLYHKTEEYKYLVNLITG